MMRKSMIGNGRANSIMNYFSFSYSVFLFLLLRKCDYIWERTSYKDNETNKHKTKITNTVHSFRSAKRMEMKMKKNKCVVGVYGKKP